MSVIRSKESAALYIALLSFLVFALPLSATGTYTLTVSPPSLTIPQNGQAMLTVTTTASGGFNSSISLSASGIPTGVSVSFNPTTIGAPGSGSSVMTITTKNIARTGTYPITVTGNGGGVQQNFIVTLTITAQTKGSFTLTAVPSSLTVPKGQQGTSTIYVIMGGGFNSSVSLSASGMPTGTTVGFSPQTIPAPGDGISTLTFTVGSNTPTGTYPITVTGTGKGIQQNTMISLTVTAGPTFTISASPSSLTVKQGNQGTSTITTAISGGFNSSISLSASGVPTNTTVSFNPNPIPAPGNGSSLMTITVGASTPTGTYPITVTGNGGGIQQTTTVTLTVVTPPNFSISASPSSVTVKQGNQGTSTITTAISGGFNSSISLSTSGVPTNTTVGFNPNPIPAPGNGSSLMTITVGANTPTGTYPITVTGTGGGIQQTTTVTLTVTSQGQPSFSLAASPSSLNIVQGTRQTTTITATISNGFNSSITLTASNAPANTFIQFVPRTIPSPGSGKSTMYITVGADTPVGTYPITVIGNGGGVQQNTIVTLTVTPAGQPNFSISASPSSVTIKQGNQGNSTITTAISGGFNSSIALSASGTPSGTTVNFNPNPIPAPGNGSSLMTITVGGNTPVGSYPITVTGNGGGIQQTTTVTLTVTAQGQPNYSLAASPSSLTVVQGNQGTSNITATISGGFNSSIALSASGTPSGTTVSFNPNPIPAPGSGSSVMTITVGGNTPVGTYPITVTGNGGGIQQTTTVTLTVTTQQQQQGSFSISASPFSVIVRQGNQGAATVTTAIGSGFNSAISLSASGVPGGTTVSFNPQTIPAPGDGSSAVTITVGSGTLSGAYAITITGSGGGIQRTATFTLTVTTSDSASAPFPTPPQVYLDTTWNQPNGTTWNVGCSGNRSTDATNFQNAINKSVPGDLIVVTAGCTYSGNFVLPPKSNPNGQWIYIESSGLANLPPPGTRVGPSNAAQMATITTPNTTAALLAECSGTGSCGSNGTNYGANHFRMVGLELTTTSTYGCKPSNNPPTACWSYYIFQAQSPDDGSTGFLPDSITVDRCYIHGLTNGANSQDVSHGIGANGTNLAVIDSYISDIHITGTEAQGILAYYTPGPLKIVDNYISSSTQEILIGGAGGTTNPYVPADIEIRRNTLYKPTAWDSCGTGGTVPPGGLLPSGAACPSGSGAPINQWIEKNNLELKSARRVAITGNSISNVWVAGQTGSSVLFTIRTDGNNPLSVVDDILFQSNVLQNVDEGISTLEEDDLCGPPNSPNCTNPGEVKRVWVNNNLFLLSPSLDTYEHTGIWLDGGCNPWSGGCQLGPDPGMIDFMFQHNTVLMSDGSTLWAGVYFKLPNNGPCPPTTSATHNVWVLDNALALQPGGDCGYEGKTGLGYYMGDPSSPPLAQRFYGNVMFVPSGDGVQSWPGTSNDATTVPFTYADPGNGDYQLLVPDWLTTTDGNVSGIDWSAMQQAMNP